MRVWALVLVLLVSPAMAAPPDIIGQAHWLWAPRPKASPAVAVPAPAPQARLETAPMAPVEPTGARANQTATSRPESVARKKRARPVESQKAANPRTAAAPISCSDARQGVGMPCFLIRANAHHYERLTVAQKRQADNCLTHAEREAIRACFR